MGCVRVSDASPAHSRRFAAPEARRFGRKRDDPSERAYPESQVAKAVSSWCVYVLRCGDGTLYTGVTNDPERRLRQHSDGTGARYTRSRLPVTIVYQETAADRGTALRREVALKRLSRMEKLALIA